MDLRPSIAKLQIAIFSVLFALIASAVMASSSASKSLNDIAHDTAIPYQGVLAQGYTTSAYWIRIEASQLPHDERIILSFKPHYVQDITLFDPEHGQTPSKAGSLYPPLNEFQSISSHAFVLHPQSDHEVY